MKRFYTETKEGEIFEALQLNDLSIDLFLYGDDKESMESFNSRWAKMRINVPMAICMPDDSSYQIRTQIFISSDICRKIWVEDE